MLVITPKLEDAEAFVADLGTLLPNQTILQFADREIDLVGNLVEKFAQASGLPLVVTEDMDALPGAQAFLQVAPQGGHMPAVGLWRLQRDAYGFALRTARAVYDIHRIGVLERLQ